MMFLIINMDVNKCVKVEKMTVYRDIGYYLIAILVLFFSGWDG